MLSKEMIRQYINHCRYKKNYAERTLQEYENDLTLILAYLNRAKYGDEASLNEIEIEGIESYIEYCKEKKLNDRSISRKISVLNGYLKYSHKRFETPLIEYKGVAPKQKTIYTYLKKGEREILLNGLGPKSYFRNKAIILLVLDTGAKVKEVYRLNYRENIEEQIKIGDREVILSSPCKRALRDYLNNERGREPGALFLSRKGTRLTPRSIQRMLEKASECSGLHKNITPETLRQTYIVQKALEGMAEEDIRDELKLKEPLALERIQYL